MIYVDASALVAILCDEPEAERCSNAIVGSPACITSPVAVLEAALAIARPDKLGLSVEAAGSLVLDFIEERGIAWDDCPPSRLVRLALHAAAHYRQGRSGLNLGDCLHYA